MTHPEHKQFWTNTPGFKYPDSRSPRLPSEVKGWNDEPYGKTQLNMTTEEYKEIFGEPVAKPLETIDGMVAATKHDTGKTDWSLLPWDAVEEIIKVLQFGAGKYSPWNWAENGGFKFNRLFNSSMRHFVAWFWRREDLDPETGISHMAHLGCNVLFLLHYVLNGNKFKNNDNRPNVR